MSSLKNFIIVHENIVPHSLCDDILAEYADSNDWQKAVTGDKNEVRTDVRNCSVIGISTYESIAKNETVRRKLDSEVFKCASVALQKYKESYNRCLVKRDTGYDLLRYKEGQFYITHTDTFAENPREVSCSFALNDDFEGGEFAFFNKEVGYKLSKGSALMFPSNFMYPHEITQVTKGTRYSIVTWFK